MSLVCTDTSARLSATKRSASFNAAKSRFTRLAASVTNGMHDVRQNVRDHTMRHTKSLAKDQYKNEATRHIEQLEHENEILRMAAGSIYSNEPGVRPRGYDEPKATHGRDTPSIRTPADRFSAGTSSIHRGLPGPLFPSGVHSSSPPWQTLH
jgi:hypothetical protein